MKLQATGIFLLFCFLVLSAAGTGYAGETTGESADDGSQQVISLPIRGLVHEVVKRNSALLYERMQLAISAHRVDYEKYIFEPELFANVNYHGAESPNNTAETISRGGLETYNENQWTFRSGIGGLLPTGAHWDLEYSQSRTRDSLIKEFKSYNHEYESQIKMTLRQPLLKGLGSAVTLSEYHKAVIDNDMLKGGYEKKTMDLIGFTVREYWKLYGAQILVKNLKKSVGLLDKSLSLLNERYKSGDVSEYEVLEARSSLLARRVELQSIENSVDESQRALFKLLNVYDDDHIVLVAETGALENQWVEQPFDSYFEYARKNWPAFQIAHKKYEKTVVQFKKAKNEARPELDLVGSAWLSNLDDRVLGGKAFKSDYPSWEAGLEFKMPILWGRRQKQAVKMVELEMRQAETELKNLEREVRIDLKSTLQTLKNSKKQLDAMQQNNDIKQQLLRHEFERFAAGEIEVRELIEKEDDVTTYQRKLVNRLIGHQLNQASFDKAVGIIIDKYFDDQDILSLGVEGNGSDTITDITFK